MLRCLSFALLAGLLCGMLAMPAAAQDESGSDNYLYYRDANVPPFQKSREFFDMPNRPGDYEVSMVADAIGPLTFRVVRVIGEQEVTMTQRRSYKVGSHEFQYGFTNPTGKDDLIVEISNSNPAATAKVAVIVVEFSAR